MAVSEPTLMAPETFACQPEIGPLLADIQRGEHARTALALARQETINQAVRRVGRHSVDGLGELRVAIHPQLYFAMREKFGAECWQDPAFVKSVLAKNPGMRPARKPRRVSVRV